MIKSILKQINSYGRESFFVVSTNIIQVAEKIIILVIVSSALSIGDFGIFFGLALTVQTFFNQFLFVPFSNGFFRFLLLVFLLIKSLTFMSHHLEYGSPYPL